MSLTIIKCLKVSMSRDGKEWVEINAVPRADIEMKAYFNSRFTPPKIKIIGEKVIIN